MTDQQSDIPRRGQSPMPPVSPGATAQSPAVVAKPSWWGRLTPAGRALLIIAAAVLPVFLCIGGLVVVAIMSGDPPEEAAPATATTPVSTPSASPTPAVVTRITTETEEIPFEEVVTEDATLPEGTQQVRTEGATGLKTITYEVTFTDGVETDRRLVKEEITQEPVDRVVVVGTKAPEPEPEPEEPSNCDPNYAGACVPIASDVDCEGGSGNGPAYVRGPVQVVGEDVYDLDSDNDGIGCE